jgi:hypothetical protein
VIQATVRMEPARFPNYSPLTRAELVAAALSAGYGKEQAWTRTYLRPRSDRVTLYRYLRARVEMTLSCVNVAAGTATPKPFLGWCRAIRKGELVFQSRILGAAVAATRWMGGAGPSSAPLLAYATLLGRRYRKYAASLRFPKNTSLPDYLIEDSVGGWHVLRSKGRRQRQPVAAAC